MDNEWQPAVIVEGHHDTLGDNRVGWAAAMIGKRVRVRPGTPCESVLLQFIAKSGCDWDGYFVEVHPDDAFEPGGVEYLCPHMYRTD